MALADLSIIVNNYNKPHEQIMECMDSIKEQTIQPREVILVDDCSDDPRAHAIATSIILPKNIGVAKARDIGVHMSKGRLLLFVDADDKLAPDFIEQCGKIINKVDIAYPNVIKFGNIEVNKLIETPDKITPKLLMYENLKLVVTSMMHKYIYKKLNGFNNLPIYEDWDFWLRAMAEGFTFGKANTLFYYRQNRKSRNHLPIDKKHSIHRKITAPYKVVKGKLERKNEKKKT